LDRRLYDRAAWIAFQRWDCHGDGYMNLAIIQKRPHYEEGLYHFGIEVDDIEKLKPLCKELAAASEIQKRPPNREAEYRVADPDGNLIDLSQHGWPV
jgi:catechol 2,3-dioxygenase-like lactoylglutathione lyase family enzyme